MGALSDAFKQTYLNTYYLFTGDHPDSYKTQMKPVSNYLSIIERARIEKETKARQQQTYTDRFSGRYGLSLEEKAQQRVNEINSNYANTTTNTTTSDYSTSESDLLGIGLIALILVLFLR